MPTAPAQVPIPEVVSSALTFLGGVLLTVDALSPVRALYVKRGAEKWHWLVSKLPRGAVEDDHTMQDEKALSHAKLSQFLVRLGFILITVGFLIDILSKLHWL